MAFELTPITEGSLPPAVQRIVKGPPSAKMMALKGIAPLRPVELAMCLYQLSFDGEASVKAAAEASPQLLPDKLLVPALGDAALPAPVIHFFAHVLPADRVPSIEKILYNPTTADETMAMLARKLDERELDVIAQNEARLLRHPAIVEALFGNPRARMSSVNRAIELCARNGVRVEGIPSFDEIARSIGADPDARKPEVADTVFSQIFSAVVAVPEEDVLGHDPLFDEQPDDGTEPLSDAEREAMAASEAAGDQPPSKGKSLIPEFNKLKLHEKIRLATIGNAFARQTLMRDSNKMVAMAAVKSPGITDIEIVRASGNRALSEDVVRYIANQREYVKMYPVKVNLVHNPKCPLAISLRFLPFLQAEDVKRISRSKNIPSALSTAARKLVQQRGG